MLMCVFNRFQTPVKLLLIKYLMKYKRAFDSSTRIRVRC